MVLKPVGGLCNRMRAIDSAIAFCEKYNRNLMIYWILKSELNAPFHTLFNPLKSSIINITVKNLKRDNLITTEYRRASKLFRAVIFNKVLMPNDFYELFDKKFDFNLLNNYRNIYVSSFSRFYPNENKYSIFKPRKYLLNEVDNLCATFDENTIGVHIRRSDHNIAIEKSPIELFINKMEAEIKTNPNVNFFIASDSLDTKIFLDNKFKTKIKCLDNIETSRNKQKGIESAIIDLYALSRTKKILGSYGSSFSTTAGDIGYIDVIYIKK